MTDDPMGDAVRADADAAREEIRAAGLVCPSCGKNIADVYGSHRYEDLDDAGLPRAFNDLAGTLKCTEGEPVAVTALAADWVKLQAVANIAVMDAAERRFDEWFSKNVTGTGPANFTGLLSVLGDEENVTHE